MGRLFRVIKGWFLRLVGKAEELSPRAMLEAEVDSFHRAIQSYNTNLAKQAGMIERLKRQIIEENKKLEMLTARVTAAYQAKNMEKAGNFALQVKEAKRELEENESQLTQAEELYQNLVKQRDTYTKTAREKIEGIKSKISRAEMAEAQAKLTEIASNTAFDMTGSGASLERLEEKLEERIADAEGKVRVASDAVASDEWSMTEAEQGAMEAQALAEFAAQMGLEPPPVVQTPDMADAKPDLGPVDPVEAVEAPKVTEG